MCSDFVKQQEALESAVDELLASCDSDKDRQMILQQFAALEAKLVCIKDAVERKAAAYDVLLEHSRSRAAARVTLAHVHKRLKDELTAQELCDLQSDLDRARSDLVDLETHHLEMDALLTEAGITVRHRDTENVTDVKDDVEKLLSAVESDEKKLKLCLRVLNLNFLLSGASNNLNEMSAVYLDDVAALGTAVKVSCLYMLSFVGNVWF